MRFLRGYDIELSTDPVRVFQSDGELRGSTPFRVRVEPGDLVIADETSVCFVPRDRMTDVLTLAQQKAEAEEERCQAIDEGIPVPDISRATYGEKG